MMCIPLTRRKLSYLLVGLRVLIPFSVNSLCITLISTSAISLLPVDEFWLLHPVLEASLKYLVLLFLIYILLLLRARADVRV